MRAEKDKYPVSMMARTLKVSRSGFYSWLAKGEPDDPWAGLRAEVERVWLGSDRTFGPASCWCSCRRSSQARRCTG